MELYSMGVLLLVGMSLAIHEILGKTKSEYQWIARLAVSILFYTLIAKLRIVFLALSVVSVWASAVYMEKIAAAGKAKRKAGDYTREEKKALKKETQKKKRVVLYMAILFNLGILILVRYILPVTSYRIVLPLGISFYTFMAISYLIDVYGEKYEAEKNAAKIALYLSWFPQMLQGPINRFDYVRDSLFGVSRLTYEKAKSCGLLFLIGAVKKYALANALAPTVNEILLRNDLSDVPGSVLLFTAFLYAIEQYADFSGGIDMVLGISGLFGVRMNENFRQPYFSKSVAEFWRRWHISLGAFLRDYVFYPFAMLPGIMKLNDKLSKRCGKHIARSVVGGLGNLLVFLLVGLWHGSEAHYIAWGLYNGVIIALSDLCAPAFTGLNNMLHINGESRSCNLFRMIRTFAIITLAGYFDVVPKLSNGFICFKNTFTAFNASQFKVWLQYIYDCGLISDVAVIVAILAAVIVLTFSIMRENKIEPIDYICSRKIVARWAIYLVLIYVMLFGFASAGENGGFMYAGF